MFEIAHQGLCSCRGRLLRSSMCSSIFMTSLLVYVAAGVNIPLFLECVVVQIRVFFLDFRVLQSLSSIIHRSEESQGVTFNNEIYAPSVN
jgi:hypothetical protein